MNFNSFLPGIENVLVTKMEKIEESIAFDVDDSYTSLIPACQTITT